MDTKHAITIGLVLLAAASGCKKKTATKASPTSNVAGALAVASFRAPPLGVDAIDETGSRVRSDLRSDGGFDLVLESGHVYRLVVVGPKGEEPVVFPRGGGRLDRALRTPTASGRIDLGAVRHLDRAPATGFPSVLSTKGAGAGAASSKADEGSESVDGEDDDGEANDDRCSADGEGADGDAVDPAAPMSVPEASPPEAGTSCGG